MLFRSQYVAKLHEIYSLIVKANTGTTIDWPNHLHNYGLNQDLPVQSKKIHLNDAIKGIEKDSNIPLTRIYELMSEFVHPNYGSRTLMINTKKTHDFFMEKLIVGENSRNPEAALWYMDNCAEGLYYTLTMCMSLFNKSKHFLDAMHSFIQV